jgi:DNA-directed RNA polymerase subunit K
MVNEIEKFTKYEKARMIGSRALQISMGAPFEVKLTKKQLEEIGYNPVEIAKMEFDKGVIPLTVVRPFPKREDEQKEL